MIAGEADRGGAARPGLLGGEHVDAGDAERDRQIADCGRAAGRVDLARHRMEGRPEEGIGAARGDAVAPSSRRYRRSRSMKARAASSTASALRSGSAASSRSSSVISGWRLQSRAQRLDRVAASAAAPSRSASQAARAAPAIIASSPLRNRSASGNGKRAETQRASAPRQAQFVRAQMPMTTATTMPRQRGPPTSFCFTRAVHADAGAQLRDGRDFDLLLHHTFPSDCRIPTKEERSGRLRFGQKPPAVCCCLPIRARKYAPEPVWWPVRDGAHTFPVIIVPAVR